MARSRADTVADIFNKSQSSTASHPKYAKQLWLQHKDDQAKFDHDFKCFLAALLQAEKGKYTDRLVRLVKSFASHLSCDDESQVEQIESIVTYVLDKGEDVSKGVRVRAGLLVHTILNSLPLGAELSEGIFEALEAYALARLADKEIEVRVHAALCSKRLPEPNEDGEFCDSEIVKELARAATCERNKSVRIAALDCIPAKDQYTLDIVLQCLADAQPEVRKAALQKLQAEQHSVPPQNIRVEQLMQIVRKGLRDRDARVHEAAVQLLSSWYAASCEEDLELLLDTLQSTTHLEEGEMVLEALFTAGVVEPMALAQWMAKGSEGDVSLRSLPEGSLLRPLQALIMRVLCQWLQRDANSRGMHAATSRGAAASMEAAEACSRHEVLDSLLPETAGGLLAIIQRHASSGPDHLFTTCQLLTIAAECLDWTDGAAREQGTRVLMDLLHLDPCDDPLPGSSPRSHSVDATCLAGQGGDSSFERALMTLGGQLYGSSAALAEAVLGALPAVARQWELLPAPAPEGVDPDTPQNPGAAGAPHGSVPRWLQLLAWLECTLQGAASSPSPAGSSQARSSMQAAHEQLTAAALEHPDTSVRSKALHCTALHALTLRSPSALTPAVLRPFLDALSHAPDLHPAALRALCDLCLHYGTSRINSLYTTLLHAATHNPPTPGAPPADGEPAAAAAPGNDIHTPAAAGQQPSGMVELLLGRLNSVVYDRPAQAAAPSTRGRTRRGSTASRAAPSAPAPTEEQKQVAEVVTEGLAKLLLHQRRWGSTQPGASSAGLQDGEVGAVLAALLLVQVHPASEDLPFVQQCLTVFMQAYTNTAAAYAASLAAALPRAARSALHVPIPRSTAAPALVKYVAQLLHDCTPAYDDSPAAAAVVTGSQEALAEALLCEAITVARSPFKASLAKPYTAALCKAAAMMAVRGSEQEAVRRLRTLAQHAAGVIATDRAAAADLAALQQRLEELEEPTDEPLPSAQLNEMLSMYMARTSHLPHLPGETQETPAGASAPATTRRRAATTARKGGRKAAAAAVDSDDSDGEEEDEEAAGGRMAEQPPCQMGRRRPQRAAAAATNRRLSEMLGASEDDQPPAAAAGRESPGVGTISEEEEEEDAASGASSGAEGGAAETRREHEARGDPGQADKLREEPSRSEDVEEEEEDREEVAAARGGSRRAGGAAKGRAARSQPQPQDGSSSDDFMSPKPRKPCSRTASQQQAATPTTRGKVGRRRLSTLTPSPSPLPIRR